MSTEINTKLGAAQALLNLHYPTKGDGTWSIEFIKEIWQGNHIGHENHPAVVACLANVGLIAPETPHDVSFYIARSMTKAGYMNENGEASPLDERKCPRCHTLRISGTRHCISCGHTPNIPVEDQIRLGLISPHKKLEPKEGQDVLDVLKTFGLTLPSNAIEWRVCKHRNEDDAIVPFIPGTHPLYSEPVTALLTDGIVAFFAIGFVEPGCRIFFGHLANMTPNDVEGSEDGAPRKETKRARALRLLANED